MSAAPDLRVLEQLVDGELSPEAYRAALRALDAQPNGWKTLAGLFLETQALRGDLAPSVTKHLVQQPPPKAAAAPQWAWLAACLVLGIGLGSLFSPRGSAPTNLAENPPTAAPTEERPAALREISVPVYSAGEVDPLTLWTSSTALPPGLVEQARERHQQVVREYQLIPVALEDGRQVAFPVERVKLVDRPTY